MPPKLKSWVEPMSLSLGRRTSGFNSRVCIGDMDPLNDTIQNEIMGQGHDFIVFNMKSFYYEIMG